MEGVNFYRIFLISTFLLLGIFIAEYITGRSNSPQSSLTNYSNQKFPSLFIGFGVSTIERVYHIHHWVWASLSCILAIILNYWEVGAFLLGIALQGLSYEDRFMFSVDVGETFK